MTEIEQKVDDIMNDIFVDSSLCVIREALTEYFQKYGVDE